MAQAPHAAHTDGCQIQDHYPPSSIRGAVLCVGCRKEVFFVDCLLGWKGQPCIVSPISQEEERVQEIISRHANIGSCSDQIKNRRQELLFPENLRALDSDKSCFLDQKEIRIRSPFLSYDGSCQ
jgi:hypothetical protein